MMTKILKCRPVLALVAALAMIAATVAPTMAEETEAEGNDQQAMVDSALRTLEDLMADDQLPNFKAYLAAARAVYIVPSMYKAGFLLGDEGGTGVVLARGADGTWSSPAFCIMAGGSLGFQLGVKVSEVVFTIMNDEALQALIEDQFKMGGDLSVVMGPVGAGVESAMTTNFAADVYAFSHGMGIFAGGAFKGNGVFNRETWNQAYYGGEATPEAILLERRFNNPNAEPLKKLLP